VTFQTCKTTALAAAIVGTLAVSPVMAQETSDSSSELDGWDFTIAPYLFAAGLEGDVAAFGLPTVSVDASFGDIADNLEMALAAYGEARRDRLGIYLDFLYLDIETSENITPGPFFTGVTLSAQTLIVTPMIEYRVYDRDGATLDSMAGARIWDVDVGLNVSSGLLAGVNASDGDSWADPVLGLKGQMEITDKLTLGGWGMVGGFGANSDFMWDAYLNANYAFVDWFALELGYRGLGVDYQDGGFVFDVTMSGPMIAAVFTF
jgi:hypothetical protein